MGAALEFVFSAAISLFQGATYDYYHIFLLTLQELFECYYYEENSFIVSSRYDGYTKRLCTVRS